MSKYPKLNGNAVRASQNMTHEAFIHAVRLAALRYAERLRNDPALQRKTGITPLTDEQFEDIEHAKLIYGRGSIILRGITQHGGWNNGRSQKSRPGYASGTSGPLGNHHCAVPPVAGGPKSDDLVEVCALGEDSPVQVAGTTVHELAHVACGMGVGHSKQWKETCAALGLRCVRAAGTRYSLGMFAPELRAEIVALKAPEDGFPANQIAGLAGLLTMRPCRAGIGTRGGHSRGPGSGRLRKYVCPHGQIIRASTDELDVTCNVCGGKFEQPQSSAVAFLAAVGI